MMTSLRQKWISRPIMERIRHRMPSISDTERQALEAGGVWWDAELMSGRPDWSKLETLHRRKWSAAEQAFLDGPVAELCHVIDDWHISYELRDLPASMWQFLKDNKFFGMIIPPRYGGLGFSAAAHSEVICRIATCSTSVAVTVMVPNSLGPAELLLEYGTEEQKQHYLPRLADGRDIPCFGLTSREAGSDASAMVDHGVVCHGEFQGKRTLGMRLNWRKRYITLGPVATLIGLAFKLYDPDHLLGEQEELGITVALIPAATQGVKTGDRHYPAQQAFLNGPIEGTDVFVPLEYILGGQAQIGQGWKMLMSALAAGRSISLPSMSTACAKLAACSTGAYSVVREQFGMPISKFEGVQQRLAQIAGTTYLLDAGRQITAQALDLQEQPAVISAILKAHSTYRFREVIIDAMDVHGGKTICDGPNNYLGNIYRVVPVAITVEGANILTRSLIIFGQGAIRCHPFLLEEIKALEDPDREAGLKRFDALLFRHLRFQLTTLARAWFHAWTGGRFAATPERQHWVGRHYRQISRYSSALALLTECALLALGGKLKRKEFLSARIGDVLSELYLLSCVLRRFEQDQRPEDDRALVEWCMHKGLWKIDHSVQAVLANFPSRPLAWLMRFLLQPLGVLRHWPLDSLTRRCADLLTRPSSSRTRLVEGVYTARRDQGIGQLEEAFEQMMATTSLRARLKRHDMQSVAMALEQGIVTAEEAKRLAAAEAAVARALDVDSFSAEALRPARGQPTAREVAKRGERQPAWELQY